MLVKVDDDMDEEVAFADDVGVDSDDAYVVTDDDASVDTIDVESSSGPGDEIVAGSPAVIDVITVVIIAVDFEVLLPPGTAAGGPGVDKDVGGGVVDDIDV